ncbi:hypothetical protein FACS189427_05750 [Planctomycetales bacterium]|nr:hypothetical protein FACS189427_05750 [Planctomycetales bacterium]
MKNIYLAAVVLSLCISAGATAQTAAPPQTPQQQFLTKAEFEQFLRQYHKEQTAQETQIGGLTPSAQDTSKLAWKKGKFTITPYGYVNLSASYDSQKAVNGDYCAFINSPDLEDASGFQVDAKSSRFGFMLDGPGLPNWSGSRINSAYEFDFQGALSVRNRPGFMMRKAYVSVGDKYTKFLAGQDWEVISPLYPKTLNYTSGAAVGNNGYRRAMLKVDRRYDLTNSGDLLFQFALCDNVLRDASGVNWCTASMGNYPVLEGRIAYAFGKNRYDRNAGFDCNSCGDSCDACGNSSGKLDPITIGVSAHLGEQRFDYTAASPNGIAERRYHKTWSFNGDLDVPLSKRLRFQAEYFIGDNLSGVEGGIMQGVDLYLRRAITSQGGWAGLQYFWTRKLQSNVCYSIDDPLNNDVLGGTTANGLARTYNQCIFVNAMYNWTEMLMTGIELSFWRTNWQQYNAANNTLRNLRAGEDTRVEFVTRFTF